MHRTIVNHFFLTSWQISHWDSAKKLCARYLSDAFKNLSNLSVTAVIFRFRPPSARGNAAFVIIWSAFEWLWSNMCIASKSLLSNLRLHFVQCSSDKLPKVLVLSIVDNLYVMSCDNLECHAISFCLIIHLLNKLGLYDYSVKTNNTWSIWMNINIRFIYYLWIHTCLTVVRLLSLQKCLVCFILVWWCG